MIDSLVANVDRARARPVLERIGVEPGQYAALTLHRPVNVDHRETLADLLGAVAAAADAVDLPVVFPVHPRTRVALGEARLPAQVRAVAPLVCLHFLALGAGARRVLTDSEGTKEEAAGLGVPFRPLRDGDGA